MLLSADDRLARARAVLETRGVADAALLPPAISDSWRRCLAAGLDPRTPPALVRVEAAALMRARDRAGALRRLAMAELQQLYQQIAGTNYMVAFASPDGLVLDTIADTSFSATARAASIAAGSVWEETRCGTNALGTAATAGAAIVVNGGEHFFARHGGLTCTAAPVLDPDGLLVGVLDASSDYRSRQQHTRALVTMAATQIENGLLRERHGRQMLVTFHSRAEYLHTLSAGLLAVDPDGRILAANPQARFLLQGLPAMRGRHFDDVFRTRLGALIDTARGGGASRIEDRVGSVYAARLENAPAPVLSAAPVASRAGGAPLAAPAFVAEDHAVASVVREVAAAARRGFPILIRGETGTGKEQLARYAHAASGRTGGFVPVNCAALPETLAEAELFGHADGAFTGARRGGAPGLVVEAHGGTLFLDEIGDMKPGLQALLLRLLDDWTVRPVGGGRTRQVDVLLVAATNIDIETAVQSGRFRPDLFFRVSTIDVTLPPLSVRQDFGRVAGRVLETLHGGLGLSSEAAALLAARAWPGNIRELRSALTRLALRVATDIITADDVVGVLGPPRGAPVPPPDKAEGHALRSLVQQRVRLTYEAADGNVSETARRLRVSRNTVYRSLHGGPCPPGQGRRPA